MSAITRRMFLTHGLRTGGVVFVGCQTTAAAQQAPSPRRRRPVVIKGRRVRTIDVHAHCEIPAAVELLSAQRIPQQRLVMEAASLDQRLKGMDAEGIDVQVLSINPTWYAAERDLAGKIIDVQNTALAELCSAHSDRFAAFASVALQFPDLAAEELVHAIKQLGLRGVAIGGSVGDHELSDPQFHPFWAAAEELGCVVFIHPQLQSNDLNGRLKGNGFLGNVIGNPLETTIALSHLIFEGTLDRFPGVKICAAHGGGYLPSYMHRSDQGCIAFPERCTPDLPKKRPTDYVKQLYYDSLVFTPEGLRHLVAEVGADHVVLGTDYPFPWVSTPVDHVFDTHSLTDREREAILGRTAERLLGLASRVS
jgi:aminocarboxymuconate-semialdehyde decarboxylase